MLVAVHVGESGSAEWRDRLHEALPEFPCRIADESLPSEQVTHAAVWQPPAGWLATLPRLRCVVSLAAGVDHILEDPAVPQGVPVLRLGGEPLAARMREYVLLAVLSLHRDLLGILESRRGRVWTYPVSPTAAERVVGIMGLGALGREAANVLSDVGFQVSGWSRRRQQIPGVRCFGGDAELGKFLHCTEILVNLLPLTASTRSMFDRSLYARLPKGAGFVNVGRGPHVVEEDLLDALESGQLSGAVLDCFLREPLPNSHPFWRHPRILVTPHVAAPLSARTATRLAADLIRRFEKGEALPTVDVGAGY